MDNIHIQGHADQCSSQCGWTMFKVMVGNVQGQWMDNGQGHGGQWARSWWTISRLWWTMSNVIMENVQGVQGHGGQCSRS